MYLFCDAVLRVFSSFAKIQRVEAQGDLQSYWALSNADPDLLKNYQASINVGPSSARISLVGR